jgi:DNA-binding MarR family transcriptional regulator
MKKKEQLFEQIIKSLFLAKGMINCLEKKEIDVGADQKLYPSELHLIAAVKHNPKTHMKCFCEILRVTKGAISQTVKKLLCKGLVKKIKTKKNKKLTFLELTSDGERVCCKHKNFHKRIFNCFEGLNEDLSEKDMEKALEVIKAIGLTMKTFWTKELNIECCEHTGPVMKCQGELSSLSKQTQKGTEVKPVITKVGELAKDPEEETSV